MTNLQTERKMLAPTSEKEFEEAKEGDLVKADLFHISFEWMVYEGVVEGKDAFMFIDKRTLPTQEYPNILSYRSHRKYLHFSGEEVPPFRKGVEFDSLHKDVVVYTPNTHPEIYVQKLNLLERLR